MNFKTWFKGQREEWNVQVSELTQRLSVMEQAYENNLNFSILEDDTSC